MTPERKAEIRQTLEYIQLQGDAGTFITYTGELLSEVDRLEEEIARYREKPNAKMLCKIHSEIPADPNGFIVTYEQLDAALEAYRSAVK